MIFILFNFHKYVTMQTFIKYRNNYYLKILYLIFTTR